MNMDPKLDMKPRDAQLREQLEVATERMNVALDAAEKKLGALGLGVAAFVEIQGGQLHFRKVERGWALVVFVGDSQDAQPVRTLARYKRIEVISKFDDLANALREEAARKIEQITAAAVAAERFEP